MVRLQSLVLQINYIVQIMVYLRVLQIKQALIFILMIKVVVIIMFDVMVVIIYWENENKFIILVTYIYYILIKTDKSYKCATITVLTFTIVNTMINHVMFFVPVPNTLDKLSNFWFVTIVDSKEVITVCGFNFLNFLHNFFTWHNE